MLERLEILERRLEPFVRVLHVVVTLMVSAFLAIVLLHDERPTSRGGLVLLLGVMIAATVSAKPITTGQHLEMLREASRSRRFWWRLMGFILVVVGTSLILRTKAATFLEEVSAIVIMTYVWFCNVLQVSED